MRWTRRLRRPVRLATAALIGFAIASGSGCVNPSFPTDLALNVLGTPHHESLEAEGRALVVLQHGLWRSSGALWRLERSLRDHGYDVLNTSYPSTRANIEDHAALLARNIEAHLERVEAPYESVHFVGHSMGGLVIRAYLATDGALDAESCVFLGTPQRGAMLAELDHDRWWYRLFLGTQAARQLRRSDPFQTELAAWGPVPAQRVGVLFGGKGDGEGWSSRIPGDDDGTVGAEEAQLLEATATKRLRLGHTRLSFSGEMVHEVLHFLETGRFIE